MAGSRPCEQEWTAEKAEGVRLLMVKVTGKPCPCDRGLVCPLLPDVQAAMLGKDRDTAVA